MNLLIVIFNPLTPTMPETTRTTPNMVLVGLGESLVPEKH